MNGINEQEAIKNIQISSHEGMIKKVLKKHPSFFNELCNIHTEENKSLKNCSNCKNGSCNVETYEKVGIDEDGLPQGTNCFGWSNSELVQKSYVLDKKKIY